MRIPLPKAPHWFGQYLDWINRPIIPHSRVRRIDILLTLGFIGCVGYYWVTTGWQGAIVGGLLYILMTMIALWIL
jgi:hypothetical protein